MRAWWWMTFVLAAAAALPFAGACYTGPQFGRGDPSDASTFGPDGGVGAAGTPISGLPCEVANLLSRACLECHGSPPQKGAHYATASYEDLLVRPANDTRTIAEISLERMRDPSDPMPPDRLLPAAEVAALGAWIEQGMPRGACASVQAPVGTHDAGAAGNVCTSGVFWRNGDDGDERMYPGRACITCHAREGGGDDDDDERDDDAPLYTVAGTVYTGLHEPDDCFGKTGVEVLIEGANGVVEHLPVNAAGNFMTERNIELPYRAMVVANGVRRTMKTPQTIGDCNICHSEAGLSNALGRIVSP